MSSDFLAPGRLWLLLAVAALAVAYVAVLRWRRGSRVRFTQVELLDELVPHRPAWRRHVVAGVMLAGLAAAVVSTARPVERSVEREQGEGRIAVLFDVSLSMMATDVAPDRFTAAQEAAREFVAEVDDDVFLALVSFSGAVGVEVPLTIDRGRIDVGLDRLRLAEATAIGDALAVGTRLLVDAEAAVADGTDGGGENDPDQDTDTGAERSDVPGVIVLLTDGETTVGRPTMEGAAAAAEAGIPVYAISFGTPGGFIADPGGSGQIIPVPVRPDEMAAVAELTGGASYVAETGQELAEAYDEIRDSLGATLGEPVEVIDEQTWRWAMAAFVLLAAGWSLSLWWLRGLV